MATGQSIRDRLKGLKNPDAEKPGVLPLRAFYGREPKAEIARNEMYRSVDAVMNAADARDIIFILGVRGIAMVDANSSPVEHLVAHGEMDSKLDDEGMGGARYHTALKIRDLIDGAQVKMMRSPSLEGTGGGGAPSSAGDIRGYQLDCMKLIDLLKRSMTKPWLWTMIEAVVWNDDWMNIRVDKLRRTAKSDEERSRTIEALHYALDNAAVILGYLPPEDLVKRWPAGCPKMPPAMRNRIRVSTAAGRLELRS